MRRRIRLLTKSINFRPQAMEHASDAGEYAIGVKYVRITIEPEKMGGVPCIRGLRMPVATVVEMVAAGMAEDEILGEYPYLEREDIREALRFAAEAGT